MMQWRTQLTACALGIGVALTAFLAPVSVQAATQTPFRDVAAGSEYFDAAVFLKEAGVVQGYDDGELKPHNTINRAEFVKIILEGREDIKVEYHEDHSFPDVPKDAWFAPYVSTAKKLGILQGYPDGTFKPSQTINYPEAIKIILETYQVAEDTGALPEHLKVYADQWFAPYLNTAYQRNIYQAPPVEFIPQDAIERGTSFESLYRTMEVRSRGLTRFIPRPINAGPGLSLGDDEGIVDVPTGAKTVVVPVRYNDIKGELDVTLYRVSNVEDVYRLYATTPTANAPWGVTLLPEELLSKLEKITEVKRTLTKQNKEYPDYYSRLSERGELELPVSEIGFYAVRIAYQGTTLASSFVNVSDLAIMSRTGETNALVWAVNRKSGAPIEGVEVRAYTYPGVQGTYELRKSGTKETPTRVQGTTKADGVITLQAPNAQLVFATSAGQWAIMTQSMYRYTEEEQFMGYAYTERPIYRPGDVVNYRVLLRQGKIQDYKVPAGKNYRVEIRSQDDKLVHEGQVTTSEYGTATGSFTLSEASPTGYMSIVLRDGERSWYMGSTQVEAYKKDEYFLTAKADKDYYIFGQDMRITVNGAYYFGEPVRNQEVSYEVFRQEMWYPIMPYARGMEMIAIDRPMGAAQKSVLKGKGMLNADGQLVINFTPGEDDSDNTYFKEPIVRTTGYRIELSTIDESNIAVTTALNTVVHGAEYSIMANAKNYFPKLGEKQTVDVALMQPSGDAYTKTTTLGVAVTRTVYERVRDGEYYDWWRRMYMPQYTWKEYKETLGTSTVTTNAKGVAAYEFTPDLPGWYELTFTGEDTFGNATETVYYTQVRGIKDNYGAGSWGTSYLSLTPDKEKYNEGDTASIIVDAGVEQAKMLVTYTQEDMLDYALVDLNNFNAELRRVLSAKDIPGIGVHAEFLGERGFVSGYATLPVVPTSKTLDVQVTANKEVALPGEEVTYTLTVKDAKGNPVVGEFSFALIDKAVLDMRTPDWTSVFAQFYPEWMHYYLSLHTSVRHTDGYYGSEGESVVAEDAAMDDADMAANVPTLAPQAGREESKAGAGNTAKLEQAVRTDFLDTAFYRSTVVTDASGKATMTVKLPDNLTTWVGVAIGLTKDTKVGWGEGTLLTKKDVIVSPFVPRFVTMNDKAVIRAAVRNYADTNGTFAVTLQAKGARILSTPTLTTGVAANGATDVQWEIEVLSPNDAGYQQEVQLQMTAVEQTSKAQDSVVQKLPVRLLGQERVISHIGEGAATIAVKPETGNYANIRSLEISLTPTLADNVVRSIEYLVGYAYGCVEQTMSRFLPTVVAYGARNHIKFSDDAVFKDIDAMVGQGLDRLYTLQNTDGGWGWWGGDQSSLKNTAYVMYGLTQAKRAGFTVRTDVFNRGLALMEKNLKSLAAGTYTSPVESWGADMDMKRYMPYYFYVLALNGKDMSDTLSAITTDKQLAGDLAYLALGYHALKQPERAKAMIPLMEKTLQRSGAMVFTNEQVMDYERMYSRTLATSLVLEAFATVDPNNVHIEGMLRWLDSIRRDNHYGDTHTTAHAVMAVVAYMQAQRAEDGKGTTYTVRLGNETLASGSLDSMKTVTVDPKKLSASNHTLTVTKNGSGKVYYSVLAREFVDSDRLPAVANGFTVKRTYHNKQGRAVTTAKAGDIVRVNVEVNAADDSYYVMTRDQLPAGLEPVNTRLAKDAGFMTDAYQGAWVNHTDMYDHEVVMFRTRLEKGAHNFSYYARVVTPGTYTVNPSYTEMMYAPERNGASASSIFTITK